MAATGRGVPSDRSRLDRTFAVIDKTNMDRAGRASQESGKPKLDASELSHFMGESVGLIPFRF
jgi:hypothetical protein